MVANKKPEKGSTGVSQHKNSIVISMAFTMLRSHLSSFYITLLVFVIDYTYDF